MVEIKLAIERRWRLSAPGCYWRGGDWLKGMGGVHIMWSGVTSGAQPLVFMTEEETQEESKRFNDTNSPSVMLRSDASPCAA